MEYVKEKNCVRGVFAWNGCASFESHSLDCLDTATQRFGQEGCCLRAYSTQIGMAGNVSRKCQSVIHNIVFHDPQGGPELGASNVCALDVVATEKGDFVMNFPERSSKRKGVFFEDQLSINIANKLRKTVVDLPSMSSPSNSADVVHLNYINRFGD